MRASLADLLVLRKVLLADGATGTNYFEMGLEAGEPPELWNIDQPDKVRALHQRFVDAGADIILTNTFGGNRHRLKLHGNQDRVFDLNRRAAEIARSVADACPRPVIVAGSVGPTGELFVPLGALTESEAVDTFREQILGLLAGGADVAWIETMSAIEEVRAAANGAIAAGLPYTATCSFDTAGRTMMGLLPDALPAVFEGLAVAPLAMGANCGVGASDILVSLLEMTATPSALAFITKGNCGVPEFRGMDIHYSGTPEIMAAYAELAVNAGARIVGGCCGTTPVHLAAMRAAVDAAVARQGARDVAARPTIESIVGRIGPMANAAPSPNVPRADGESPRRRSRPSL